MMHQTNRDTRHHVDYWREQRQARLRDQQRQVWSAIGRYVLLGVGFAGVLILWLRA